MIKIKKKLGRFLDKIGLTAKLTNRHSKKILSKYANNGKTIDIGCGGSPYLEFFPNRIGVDIVERENVDIIADAHDLHIFKNGEFDNVLCTEALEHFHSPYIAIKEMNRVLKKGGLLILTTVFIFPLHDIPNDYYRFTEYGLRFLLRDFEIIEIVEDGNTLGTIAILFQRIGFQCETLWLKPLRIFWLLLARVINWFSFIITKNYGDVENKSIVKNIMTSGYCVVCRKK